MIKVIIGLTSLLGAGKTTIGDYLIKKGFIFYSLSDVIREEVKAKDQEITRDVLQQTGNELRKEFGSSVLADRILEKINKEPDKDFVVDSIRNPSEINALRKRKDFTLVFVDVPIETRFARIKSRKREGESLISFEDFKVAEEKELQSQDSASQQLVQCKEMADFVIHNDSSVEELHKKIDELIEGVKMSEKEKSNEKETKDSKEPKKEKYIRPTWDEYFMEVSRTIAKRATCDRGRSGCVIAKNKQLLVTGYVGSPIGMPHCDDVGHLMKKVIHDDDSISQHCVRTVHAEQNAICQAAKLGVPIEGATLYCKMTPCRVCAMLIINSGIKRVVCEKKYHQGKESEEMFLKAGIELDYFDESVEKYENM